MSSTRSGAERAAPGLGEDVIRRIAQAYGQPHAVLTASGSAALEVVLGRCGCGPGSEVIVPDEACHRVAAAVVRMESTPVFCAVGPSLVLDATAVADALTPRTMAVVVVHQYGLPAPARDVIDAAPANVTIVEDVAQAWDVRAQGRAAGAWGAWSATSFGRTKPVRVGAGGAALGDDSRLRDAVASGDDGDRERMLEHPPFPAPFPAPLLGQVANALDAADDRVARRRRFVEAASRMLEPAGLRSHQLAPGDRAAWHRLPVWAPDERTRDAFVRACDAAGIRAERPHSDHVGSLSMFRHARTVGAPRRALRERLTLLATEDYQGIERLSDAVRIL